MQASRFAPRLLCSSRLGRTNHRYHLHWRLSQHALFSTKRSKDKTTFVQQIKSAEAERVAALQEVDARSAQAGVPLEMVLSTVLERLPVVLPDVPEWEADFEALRQDAMAHSSKRYPTEILKTSAESKEAESWVYDILSRDTGKFGPAATDPEKYQSLVEQESTKAAVDRERESRGADGGAEELMDLYEGWDEPEGDIDWGTQVVETEGAKIQTDKFVPNPRVTEADKTNNTKSLDRCLSHRLYLIVQVKNELTNNMPAWRFPEETLDDIKERLTAAEVPVPSKLRDAAQSTVLSLCDDMEVYYVGNAPAGFNKFEYAPDVQKGRNKFGAQTYFYRAQSIEGNAQALEKNPDILDYAWITAEELQKFVGDVDNDPYWSYAKLLMED